MWHVRGFFHWNHLYSSTMKQKSTESYKRMCFVHLQFVDNLFHVIGGNLTSHNINHSLSDVFYLKRRQKIS